MLTNTAPAHPQDDGASVTGTTIAIEAAERHRHAAVRDIGWLADTGQISAAEAADLEADTTTRYITHVRALELHGEQITCQDLWADYEALAASRRADAVSDRGRNPRLRGLSARARVQRERQMCVVASARVSADILRLLWLDEDDETLAMRGELAAAGLL